MEGLLEVEGRANALPQEQLLEQHVQAVASSPYFNRADTLRKLLLYLWQNRSGNISEYAVATEALGRRSDFDPKTDASVRVQISRLRRKLKDFYDLEGADEHLQLQIPIGTHSLVVVPVRGAIALASVICTTDDVLPLPEPARSYRRSITIFLALAALLLLCSWFLWQRHRNATSKELNRATGFWAGIVVPGTPVKIILPTPTFFTFNKNAALHVRDTGVNSYDHWNDSTVLRNLTPTAGEPQLDHAYTVTTDTLAAISLGRYLDRVGLGREVSFEVTGDRSMGLLEQSTVVAFGAHSTLHPFREYLSSMNFSLALGEAWVENANPLPGEQKRYPFSIPGLGMTIEPALVAVLPGRSPGKKLIILQARHTASLIELLTSRVGDGMVQHMYQEHGSPEFFEMVVKSELNGDHAVRCWPVAMHPYTKPAPSGADVTQ